MGSFCLYLHSQSYRLNDTPRLKWLRALLGKDKKAITLTGLADSPENRISTYILSKWVSRYCEGSKEQVTIHERARLILISIQVEGHLIGLTKVTEEALISIIEMQLIFSHEYKDGKK